jgi:hypothetical protein
MPTFGIRVPFCSASFLPIAQDDVRSLSVYMLPVLWAAEDTLSPPPLLLFRLHISSSRAYISYPVLFLSTRALP